VNKDEEIELFAKRSGSSRTETP